MRYCMVCDKDKNNNEMYSKFKCKECFRQILDTIDYINYIETKNNIKNCLRTNKGKTKE